MRSRTDGMWWGTAVEAPDPAALARFYSALVGWPIMHEEPGTTILGAPVAEHQPNAHVRVLFDPAGHPFCLCREDG